MRKNTKAIAWDFDGVLNRNVVDGRFVWSDTLENDLGISVQSFQEGVFNHTFHDVISGKVDLKVHVQSWLKAHNHSLNADDLLSYWFAKDDLPDPLTQSLLEPLSQQGIRQVIATNNEHHRTTYIEQTFGIGKHVSRIFSSGRMGHAKPDVAFFRHISDTLELPAEDLLLIDDSAANVEAAGALGWDTFHFTEDSRTELASYLSL